MGSLCNKIVVSETPTDNQILKFDSGTDKWELEAEAGGGGGGDIPDVLYDSTYTTTIIIPASPATVDTFGSWFQYSADIGTGKKLLGIYIQNGPAALADTNNFELEIGEGAVSSEVAVSRVGGWGQGAEKGYVFTPLNRTLTNNARISVRVRDSEAGANNFAVYILVATA